MLRIKRVAWSTGFLAAGFVLGGVFGVVTDSLDVSFAHAAARASAAMRHSFFIFVTSVVVFCRGCRG